MKTRIALLAVVAMLAAAVTAPSAGAAAAAVTVKVTPSLMYECSTADGKIRSSMYFKAKIKAKRGYKKPKRVRVDYSVTDSATATVFVDEVLTLKPTKYEKFGSSRDYTPGQAVVFEGTLSYKYKGRTVRSTNSSPITIDTLESLAAQGMPACPA